MPFPKQKSLEELAAFDRGVLHILLQHKGRANSVDRWVLVEKVFGEPVPAAERNDDHVQDREIRYSVGRLREGGHLICDMGNGAGRWIAADEKEFWNFYSYYAKPLVSRANVLRAMKKAAQEQWPNLLQPSLFDVSDLDITPMGW